MKIKVERRTNSDRQKFFNGSFKETFDALVTSAGGVVTMSIEQTGTGDLTMQFSDGLTLLDTTPAATITLTAGTDASPQGNYIYIPKSTKVLTKSTSNFPTDAEHIKIAYLLVPSAAYVASEGVYINQNWNDHLENTDLQGHMTHMAERIRRAGAIWFSGIGPNGTDDSANSSYFDYVSGTEAYFKSASGVVYQMHRHAYPAKDTRTDDIHVVNWNGDSYHNINDLTDITDDSTGATLNNRFFNLTFFGVANKSGEYGPVMVNLPTGSYANQANAERDVDGFDVLTMPREFNLESSTGFLIARMTFQITAGNWSHKSTIDLRGQTPSTATGGASGTTTSFADNQFNVFNVTDSTKVFAVDVSGVTTGTTRTMTVPDVDGTFAVTDSDNSFSSTQTFQNIESAADSTYCVGESTNQFLEGHFDSLFGYTCVAAPVTCGSTRIHGGCVCSDNGGDFNGPVVASQCLCAPISCASSCFIGPVWCNPGDVKILGGDLCVRASADNGWCDICGNNFCAVGSLFTGTWDNNGSDVVIEGGSLHVCDGGVGYCDICGGILCSATGTVDSTCWLGSQWRNGAADVCVISGNLCVRDSNDSVFCDVFANNLCGAGSVCAPYWGGTCWCNAGSDMCTEGGHLCVTDGQGGGGWCDICGANIYSNGSQLGGSPWCEDGAGALCQCASACTLYAICEFIACCNACVCGALAVGCDGVFNCGNLTLCDAGAQGCGSLFACCNVNAAGIVCAVGDVCSDSNLIINNDGCFNCGNVTICDQGTAGCGSLFACCNVCAGDCVTGAGCFCAGNCSIGHCDVISCCGNICACGGSGMGSDGWVIAQCGMCACCCGFYIDNGEFCGGCANLTLCDNGASGCGCIHAQNCVQTCCCFMTCGYGGVDATFTNGDAATVTVCGGIIVSIV